MIKKIIISIFLAISLLSTFGTIASATTTEQSTDAVMPHIPQPDFLPGPDSASTGAEMQDYVLNSGIPRAINIGIGILGIGAFVGIVISTIQMLTAYGEESGLTRGKTNLKYSLLGFFIVIFAYAIVSIIVSIALPATEVPDGTTSFFVPKTYAVSAEDLNVLMPSTEDIIYNQDEQHRVNLPSGDFLTEIVPAAISNVMYITGLLIFIGLVYGGTMTVIGRGNEETLTKAKTIFLYSGIALALLSLGYAIIYGIATLKLDNESSNESDDVFTETTQNGL